MKKINLVRGIVDADVLVEGNRAIVITMGGQNLRTSPVPIMVRFIRLKPVIPYIRLRK